MSLHFQILFSRYHPLQAIPADDVDRPGSPDGLPAFGANQFARAGWPPTTSPHAGGPRLRRPRAAGPHNWRERVASQVYLIPAFVQSVLHEVVSWGGSPPVLPAGDTGQPVGLGYGLEFPIVVLPAP